MYFLGINFVYSNVLFTLLNIIGLAVYLEVSNFCFNNNLKLLELLRLSILLDKYHHHMIYQSQQIFFLLNEHLTMLCKLFKKVRLGVTVVALFLSDNYANVM